MKRMLKTKKKLRQLNPFKDRSLVQRHHARDYLLVTLISFAASVGGTRLFLELTGYPQLGSGELHIAHVLWGGLFLFIASLLSLIFINEWMLLLSSVLAGIGMGLFIDEVGKFITQSNDYFHPSAAPIVYVFFLLTVLVFAIMRQRKVHTSREEMYAILERFAEVLDQDLSRDEYDSIMAGLDQVIDRQKPVELVELAGTLKKYLETNRLRVLPVQANLFVRFRTWLFALEKKWLDKKLLKKILIFGLFIWAGWALVSPIGYLLIFRDAAQLQVFVDELITNHLVRNASGLNWFEARILLEGSMGILSLIAALFLALRSERVGVWLGLIALLVSLTVVNLLVFYFDQFSTIVLAAYQFVLMVLLIRYQRRFVREDAGNISQIMKQEE
jgi:hypothetical protein